MPASRIDPSRCEHRLDQSSATSPAEGSSSISSLRLDDQRTGDRQHLPLASRQPAGRSVRRRSARSGKERIHLLDARRSFAPAAASRRRGQNCRSPSSPQRRSRSAAQRRGRSRTMSMRRCGASCPPVEEDAARRISEREPATALIRVDLPAPFGPRMRDDLAAGDVDACPADDRHARLVAGDELLRPSASAPCSCGAAAEIGFDHTWIADDIGGRPSAQDASARHHEARGGRAARRGPCCAR